MSKRALVTVATVLFGAVIFMTAPGTAAADSLPDVVGKQYGDAKALLGQAGMSSVVATVVGDRVTQDQCYVASTSKVTARDSSGNANSNLVQVNLNCYAGQSDKTTPGLSKGNLAPDAVAIRETHDEVTKKWKASPEGQKWCASFEAEHPEWAPIPDCHPQAD